MGQEVKETQEQIREKLTALQPRKRWLLFEELRKALLSDMDFLLVVLSRKDKATFRTRLHELGLKNLPPKLDGILTEEEEQLFWKLYELEEDFFDETITELLTKLLVSETLLEGCALSCPMEDAELLEFFELVGCKQRYLSLLKDPVYQNRKAYMRLVSQSARAAVNLYGYITVDDFYDEVLHSCVQFSPEGYERTKGCYRQTHMFCALPAGKEHKWMLLHMIQSCVPEVLVTPLAELVHRCFYAEVAKEKESWEALSLKSPSGVSRADEQIFIGSPERNTSFRQMHKKAIVRKRYLPPKSEFLHYADENYYVPSEAEKDLERFLRYNFVPKIKENDTKEKFDASVERVLYGLHFQATDAGSNEVAPEDEYIQYALDLFEFEGFELLDKEKPSVKEMAKEILLDVRLWSLHAHSRNEVEGRVRSRRNSRVSATEENFSSQVDRYIDQKLNEMAAKIGFNNEWETDSYEYGDVDDYDDSYKMKPRTVEKKIYPNDPCPCGSGKKYKKCCGRNG